MTVETATPAASAAPAWTLYGSPHSGAVAVEAALTWIGLPYTLIDGATWEVPAARERVAPLNPMRQIPTLVTPDGEVMTESAAILLFLAEQHPTAALAPSLDDPLRAQFLRWMVHVSTAIYSLYWIKLDVGRIGAPTSARDAVVHAVHERIAFCWRSMDQAIAARGLHGRFILGDTMSVLDLYVAVVSRFGPWRERFAREAPGLARAVGEVDAHPRLAALWERRFPDD